MKFNQREIKRAIRDFEKKIDTLQSAGHKLYQTRVNELIELVLQNKLLSSIVGPYLTTDVDFKNIENSLHGDWYELQLPNENDLQIAYILQVMKRSSEGEYSMSSYAFRIFAQKKINENIRHWNEQILLPVLDDLITKLNDMIVDEVEGKEHVEAESLQIINYGSISSNHGNVALGRNITQTLNVEVLSDELIKQALDQGFIQQVQVEELKAKTDEIQNELEKDNPSQSILQKLASSIYDIGSKGLLSLSTNVITNPKWGKAVTDFLFGLI